MTPAADQGGLRPAAESAVLDWQRLSRALAERGHALDLDEPPRQFAGGFGNLNFLVTVDGKPCVLRRPPFGEIPRGANDMLREHRVLSDLWRAFPWAPRSLLYVEDADVIGAHFLVMEYKPGLVIGGTLPAALEAATAGPRLSRTMVELLAALHAVEPAKVGLETLGRPDGFLERNVEGWAARAEGAMDGRDTVVDDLVAWLRKHRVPDGPPTLLHSDFKLDNLVLDPDILAPRAVLDWDMSTRGDPLYDLATLLSYWTEAGDPAEVRALDQMPTAQPGFMTRAQVVAAYARQTGRDVSDFAFHRVLALFKLAIVFAQLAAQYRRGTTTDARFARFGTLTRDLLLFTHDVAHGRAS